MPIEKASISRGFSSSRPGDPAFSPWHRHPFQAQPRARSCRQPLFPRARPHAPMPVRPGNGFAASLERAEPGRRSFSASASSIRTPRGFLFHSREKIRDPFDVRFRFRREKSNPSKAPKPLGPSKIERSSVSATHGSSETERRRGSAMLGAMVFEPPIRSSSSNEIRNVCDSVGGVIV